MPERGDATRADSRGHRGAPFRITAQPEFNVAVFSLLLNLPWEFLQAPLYAGMAAAPHWVAVKNCAVAALGDTVIMLIAFWCVALRLRTRSWMCTAPQVPALAGFISVGVGITVAIEWLAQHDQWIESWRYSVLMPVLPGLNVGLAPVLQWIVLPLLTVWFARRQVAGARVWGS